MRIKTVAAIKPKAAKNVKIAITAAGESGFKAEPQSIPKICERKTSAS